MKALFATIILIDYPRALSADLSLGSGEAHPTCP
jgi:hypothetical protein